MTINSLTPQQPKSWLVRLGLLLAEIVVFVIITAAVMFAIVTPLVKLTGINEFDAMKNPYAEVATNFLPLTLGMILAVFLLSKFLFKRPFVQAGLSSNNLIPHLLKGFLWGGGLIVAGYIVLFATDKIISNGSEWNGHLFWGFFLMFLVQSFSEEVLSRGFLLPAIADRFGTWAGLLISSLLFCVLHFFNPNVNIIGGLNIFLAGMAMGILYIRYQNLWYCTGLHWGWNFTQATFFDFNVSGLDTYSFIQFKPLEPAWFTGGLFGLEGSVMSVLMLLGVCWYFGRDINWQLPFMAHFRPQAATPIEFV